MGVFNRYPAVLFTLIMSSGRVLDFLNVAVNISPTIQESTYFHHVADHDIEHRKVINGNRIIGILALTQGGEWLKGFRFGQPLIDGCLYYIDQMVRGNWILQLIGDIINRFVQILLKQRQDP